MKKNQKLEALIRQSLEAFDRLTPDEREAFRRVQRRSWVIGEMMIANPGLGRSYIEAILDGIEREK